MFDDAMAGMKSHLLHEWKRGTNGRCTRTWRPVGKPRWNIWRKSHGRGMPPGAAEAPTEMADEYLEMAKTSHERVRRCTRLNPPVCHRTTRAFRREETDARQRKNIQRPETVESLFYLYRKTGDDVYRDQAWTIFRR